jgi:hypothetical protein
MTALALCFGIATVPSTSATAQQTYQNIINRHFRAVTNGPQSALIVDVSDPSDRTAVRRNVDTQVKATLQSYWPALRREVASLRQRRLLRARQSVPIVTPVLIRSNGRPVTAPPNPGLSRAPSPNNQIVYVPNTTGSYAFDPATASTLSNILNKLLYPELVHLLGPPLWTGANGQAGVVTVLNKDDNPDKVSGIIGVTVAINGANIDIDLPTFSTDQDFYLGMLQAMAVTFHGPRVLGFDAWETGMARAAAVVAARDLQGQFQAFAESPPVVVDPAAGFYYTPYYDVLNQPALSNSTFLPPSKASQEIANQFGGMLIPRLQTSSTAWLKCYIESVANGKGGNFFVNFNSAYYDADVADPTVALDTNRLRPLAAQAIGSATVEGQPFDQWFEEQYVLDTSVLPGIKVYAFATPTLPDATHPDGVAITLLNFQTTPTGDELDLSGSCYPVYYDYTFTNRLALNSADVQIPIIGGQGDTAPTFDGLGETAQTELAMDFPILGTVQRIFFPANVNTQPAPNFTPNDIFGVVVGTTPTAVAGGQTGQITATFSGGNGAPVSIPVVQGAFGAIGGASIPNNFTQVTLSYLPAAGGAAIVFTRNVYQRVDQSTSTGLANVSSMFLLTAPAPTETFTHTFLGAPATAYLISLPFQPINPDLAGVFGTDPKATLLAEYDQSLPNDHFERYPSLPPYRAGYGLWTGFQGALNGTVVTGYPTDNQAVVNVGLEYGWNLIGTPFNANIDVTSDGSTGNNGGIQVQYLGNDAVDLGTAVTNGWIQQGVIGYDPTAGYIDITAGTTQTTFTPNMLQPWEGYWILVTVPEGVTFTYVNPNPNTRAAGSRRTGRAVVRRSAVKRPAAVGTWNLPLAVTDGQGASAFAVLGQSPRGSDQYTPALDSASPPAFSRSTGPVLRFPHPDWNATRSAQGGDFLTDIRHTGSASTWDLTVDVPQSKATYTLNWTGMARLPRGMSLTLVDLSTNTRTLMNGKSSYDFVPGQGETTRRFQITAQPRGLTYIGVTNLMVTTPAPAAGRSVSFATISYELAGVAETSVTIYSPTGLAVRRLAQGRAATPGVNQLVWDLKDDRGRALPTGVYRIEVQAGSTDGRQTRAVRACPIIR